MILQELFDWVRLWHGTDRYELRNQYEIVAQNVLSKEKTYLGI